MKRKKLKNLFKFLVILFGIVFLLSTIYIFKSTEEEIISEAPQEEPVDLYFCNQDSECATIPLGCGCLAGGIDTAISKKYVEWHFNRSHGDGGVCLQWIGCVSKAVCINSRCEVRFRNHSTDEWVKEI